MGVPETLHDEKIEADEEEETMQNLRSKAAELLLREEYRDSIEAYSKLISLCQESILKKNPDGPHLAKFRKTLCLAFSSRASARARLLELSEALKDCDEALKIDESHFKALLCKGKLFLSMNRYGMALECFKLANFDPQASENCDPVIGFLEKCKKLEYLSRTGAFDVSDWVLSGFKGKNTPEFAEYVGAVEIKRSEINGRGLFVTKNVECGTVMLVTKAIAVDRAIIMPHDCRENAHSVIWKSFFDKVVERVTKCGHVNFLISNLSTGEDEGSLEIPEIGIFRPDGDFSSSSGDSCGKLDKEKILSILDVNSILEDTVSSKVLSKNTDYQGVGLWLLASFINHSCDPNVRRLHIGDYAIVFASRDLKAGEELTSAYFDVLLPMSARKETAVKSWGFDCKCKRCTFEESLSHNQDLRDLENVLCSGHMEMMGCVVCRLEEGMRKWVVRGKGKGYLRASFWGAYSEVFGSEKLRRKWGRKVPTVESAVESVVDAVGCDERILKVFLEGLKRGGINNNNNSMEMEKGMKLGRGIYGKVMKKQAMRRLLQLV